MMNLITYRGLTIDEAESRRDTVAKIFSWGLVAGVGLVLAPLAFTLLTALVALVITAGLAMVTVALAPVAAMKLANWRMAEILTEARRNPIPTLENELLSRKAALRQAREQLKISLAQVEGFVGQADAAAGQYPDMAARWRERSAKARALADARRRSYIQASKAVDEFEGVVDRCRTEWKLVIAEAAMNSSLDATLGDPMAALRSRTAIDAVTDRMNEAFAGLEIALLEEKLPPPSPVSVAKERLAPSNRPERLPGP